MIASWGLPWTYRFVGLATLILGVVRNLNRCSEVAALTFPSAMRIHTQTGLLSATTSHRD